MKGIKLILFVVSMMFPLTASMANPALTEVLRINLAAEKAVDWHVGEYQEFDVYSSYGNMGKMTKKAVMEQGNAIWLRSEFSGMITQKVEMLVDRATGEVLEYWENGEKADNPNENFEIISEGDARVTVPAGTFDTRYIVAKTRRVKKMELWSNSRVITLDGTAQQVIDAGMITLTMKLVRFGGR